MRNMSFSSLKFGLRRHDKQERKKRSSTYPSSQGRPDEVGDVELLKVQSLERPPSVGNDIPP